MDTQIKNKKKALPKLAILAVLALGLLAIPGVSAAILTILASITGGSFTSTAAFTDGTFAANGTMVNGNKGTISGTVTNNGAAIQHRTLTIDFTSPQTLAFGTDVTEASVTVDNGSTYEFQSSDCSVVGPDEFACTTSMQQDFAAGVDNVVVGLTMAGNWDTNGNPISVAAIVN